jgi:hypothetical protein
MRRLCTYFHVCIAYIVGLCVQNIPICVRSHRVKTASGLHGRLTATILGQEWATFTCDVSFLFTLKIKYPMPARVFEFILYFYIRYPINQGPRVTSVIWQNRGKCRGGQRCCKSCVSNFRCWGLEHRTGRYGATLFAYRQ